MKNAFWNLGSVTAAFLASACCIFPLVFASLGVGSMAFATALEPYRPYFIAVTLLFLGMGFYYAYRPRQQECGPDGDCVAPSRLRWQRVFLWIVAGLTAVLIAFPYLVPYLFD